MEPDSNQTQTINAKKHEGTDDHLSPIFSLEDETLNEPQRNTEMRTVMHRTVQKSPSEKTRIETGSSTRFVTFVTLFTRIKSIVQGERQSVKPTTHRVCPRVEGDVVLDPPEPTRI